MSAEVILTAETRRREGLLVKHQDMPSSLDALSAQIVDCMFLVHKELGPGLLEQIYEDALVSLFEDRGISYERQKYVPVVFNGKVLPTKYKIDLLVAGSVVIDLKTVEKLLPVHKAQIMTYMKMGKAPLGFLVNFNETLIKEGIKRVVMTEQLRAFASSR